MAETQVQLNIGVGGQNVATFQDSTLRHHQETILQTQTGASDPVNVGASNPLPVNVSGTVAISGTVPISASAPIPISQTAATYYKLISAATTNATNIKTSAAVLKSINVGSLSTAPVYVKFYDKASTPTVGTDVPAWTILIPGGTTGSGNNPPLPSGGIAFLTGLSFAITAGIADTDTTAVVASQVALNLSYT